ncbi:hypothetical protein [Croceicoccus sp. YJ47]|uniref:hypothetical protein n=1 Tax=Croceicoccus sp. YJ47 TaxID=2798724 RepID=UPI0019242B3A|nr:hypothetical protein [Croceicoccus sp. YJ47]QQN74915.1 hypothetical protein JD971_04200 [Croceicoccus sp. YJ47]
MGQLLGAALRPRHTGRAIGSIEEGIEAFGATCSRESSCGEPTPAWARNKLPKSNLSQQDVLAGLGLLPLPPKPHKRGPILKKLVAEGVLLPNGRPNPNNDKVCAIAARPGKKKK